LSHRVAARPQRPVQFNSVNAAVDHLLDVHKAEVKERQVNLKKARDKGGPSKKHGSTEDLCDMDLLDKHSVAQQFVVEMMEVYANKIGIPRVVGRKRWFQNTNTSRVVVGFHLLQIDASKQKWGQEHREWLELCRNDCAK
jgi:hypothetical protein